MLSAHSLFGIGKEKSLRLTVKNPVFVVKWWYQFVFKMTPTYFGRLPASCNNYFHDERGDRSTALQNRFA